MRVRVLQIVLNIHQGGLERVLGDLVRGLDPARFESHVLALDFLGELSAGLEQYASVRVATPQPRWSMAWPRTLRDDIRRIAPDVVHTHSGVWFKASRAARMAGVPLLVHTDHGRQSPDPWVHRFLDGRASRRTDVVIAVSSVLGRQLAASVVHDPRRITVVRNGVDTERFRPHAHVGHVRQDLGLDASSKVIGSIGRLDPIKRFDIMVDAFALLRTMRPTNDRIALLIAGDGPDRGRIEERIHTHGLSEHVHLLGWRDDVHALHSAFTIFSMSSRSEGTSIGLLEAMSAGLCPVVTAVGGNPDVLGEALRHRLCAPEDASALADAWARALGDDERRRADAVTARERVCSTFSVRTMISAHEQIYASVPETRRARA